MLNNFCLSSLRMVGLKGIDIDFYTREGGGGGLERVARDTLQ